MRLFFVIFGAGIIMLCLGVYGYLVGPARSSAARRWPVAQGQVISSQLRSLNDEGGTKPTSGSPWPEVRYNFPVNGQQFAGNRLRFGVQPTGAEAHAVVARYAAGGPISIHYNPANPNENVIEPVSESKMLMQSMMVGAAMAAVGLFGFMSASD
jgi:hypothetical protein